MNTYIFQAAITKDGQVVAQYSRKLGVDDDGLLFLSDKEELTDGQAIAGFGHALLIASATIDEEPRRVEEPHQTGFVILPSMDSPYWKLVAIGGQALQEVHGQ